MTPQTTTIRKIDLSDFGNLFSTDPKKLSDQELLSLDFLLHKAWAHKRKGGRVHLGNKSWSFEDLVNLHAFVEAQMKKRGFKHDMPDELDRQTQTLLSTQGKALVKAQAPPKDELAPVYPSGDDLGREITLAEVLPQVKSFFMHPLFAWIVGGLANWGKTKGDVDVLWWAAHDIPEYMKKILEFRFGRQFKDPGIAGRVQHHLNFFQGPFTSAVPIYALKVERVNPEGEVKVAGLEPTVPPLKPVELAWDDLHKGWTLPPAWINEQNTSGVIPQDPIDEVDTANTTRPSWNRVQDDSPGTSDADADRYDTTGHRGTSEPAVVDEDIQDSAPPVGAAKPDPADLAWANYGFDSANPPPVEKDTDMADTTRRESETGAIDDAVNETMSEEEIARRARMAEQLAENQDSPENDVDTANTTDKSFTLRSATDEETREAKESAKEDKVKLFRFFFALKPTRGHTPTEPQTIDNFLKFFKPEDFPVYSSKKHDGNDHIIFRDGNRVQMFAEDGGDSTARFPGIVAAIKELPAKRLCLLAEVEHWQGKQHLPRETVAAYLHSSSAPDDSDFVANIYDCVFFGSESDKSGDIHDKVFTERMKYLDALKLPQAAFIPDTRLKLNRIAHFEDKDSEALKKSTEYLRALPGSEGNVASRHDSIYNLNNSPSGKVKYHNAAILNGIVTQANESKVAGVYNFFYGLDFTGHKVPDKTVRVVRGKPYHEIGTTFSTALKAKVGDIIEVEFENLNVTKNLADGTVFLTAWAPRVLGMSPARRPMTLQEATTAARRGYVLQNKEIAEDGTIIYKALDGRAIFKSAPEQVDIEKGIRQAFGSYGGKRFLAHKIASYVPHHRTYVEPFAGGGAVFFAKDPSPKEVLNDRDAEIAFMYRFIRDHAPEDRAALAKRDWVIRKETHERLKKLKPATDRDRFYKSYYLTRSSYGKQRGGSFNPANAGVAIDFPANIERAQKRLQNVAVHNKDYLDVLKKYDGPDAFFYMDPPYPGKFNLFDLGFKEESFLKALKGLKAKWIVSYPSERAGVFKGYKVYRVKRRNQMKGPGGNQEWVTELLAANFPLKPLHLYIEKALDAEPEGMERAAPDFLPQLDSSEELEKIQAAFKSPGGKYRLYKKIVPMIPEHTTFVEAFCGGAQIFFHKKRSEKEVLNDVNADLVFAYRFIKSMSPEDWEWLKDQSWIIARTRAKRLFELKPKSPRERFYRFAYLNKAQYWGRTDVWEGMRPNGSTGLGARIRLAERLPQIQERLKGVELHSWDWRDIIKAYDSPDTFFYLDPPYPLHWPKEKGKYGDKFFQEKDLVPALKAVQGKFLLSYELEKTGLFKGFKTYRIKTLHTGSHQLGGARKEYELLVSNFPIKTSGLYIEKSIGPLLKQDEIYDENPPEDKSYRYVVQSHWRGKTVHADFRVESVEKDFLIGWTLADLIEGAVKEPVETLAQAREQSKDGSAFKIDFKTGKFKTRRTRSGNIVPAALRAFPKAKEPRVWLKVEGVTPPFPAPGATRQFRGVFLIEDQGVCEYGAQKLDFHEYFLGGRLKGRLTIRRLSREALNESSKVLPPGKIDESPITSETLWVAIQPIDQTPIVLTEREVQNKWLPPYGVSALPEAVRKLIPKEFQYWKIKDRAQALKTRDDLAAAIKSGDVDIDFGKAILGEPVKKAISGKVPFALQYQSFRGQIVVRRGPSREFWTIRIAQSPRRILSFQLSSDPLKTGAASATLKIETTGKYMELEGELPPGSPLNPTKNTPSSIFIEDKGDAVVLVDGDTFKKFEFRGKKLKGLWIAQRRDVKTDLWQLSRSREVSAA
ncbi:MAG: DNA adenine methylase [Elusimicrobiota bacterium]